MKTDGLPDLGDPVVWNIERAMEHLRAACAASEDEKNKNPWHSGLRGVIKNFCLTMDVLIRNTKEKGS